MGKIIHSDQYKNQPFEVSQISQKTNHPFYGLTEKDYGGVEAKIIHDMELIAEPQCPPAIQATQLSLFWKVPLL